VRTIDVLNKLCKWRNVFAAWQLGTRPDTDGECKAVKDHREVSIIMRVELSALTGLLIEKGIINQKDFEDAVRLEAEMLDLRYEVKFPGFYTTQEGVGMVLREASATMRKMGFPP
jgi:hypothetical protein